MLNCSLLSISRVLRCVGSECAIIYQWKSLWDGCTMRHINIFLHFFIIRNDVCKCQCKVCSISYEKIKCIWLLCHNVPFLKEVLNLSNHSIWKCLWCFGVLSSSNGNGIEAKRSGHSYLKNRISEAKQTGIYPQRTGLVENLTIFKRSKQVR